MPDRLDPARVAIYARYSSDLQNPSSIDDQVALCRELIERQFDIAATAAVVFSDAAMSGATVRRSGLQALLKAVARKDVDVVVVEGLDRISRSLKDIATIHERLVMEGAAIYTAHEGHVSTLHIGVKGAMNAMYLEDLKERVRRGQRARAAEGRHPAGLSYGYRVVRGVVDERNQNVNGIREVDEDEARVVRRVFMEFADGKSVKAIARDLNVDGVPAPGGGAWRPGAIMGARTRGDGILRKSIYRGELIYNRSRPVIDPGTGRKRRLLLPETEWVRSSVPQLRIVDEETWKRAHRRLVRRQVCSPRKPSQPRAPAFDPRIHPLTGLVRCGVCGGLANLANEQRYVCAVARLEKRCANYRAVRAPRLVEALFSQLQEALNTAPALRSEIVATLKSDIEKHDTLKSEATAVQGSIGRLLTAIEEGIDPVPAAARIRRLEGELKRVRTGLRTVPVPPQSEAEILWSIARGLERLRTEVDNRASSLQLREALGLLAARITIIPISHVRQGSTIDVELRPDGWPAFWRLTVETWPEVAPSPSGRRTGARA